MANPAAPDTDPESRTTDLVAASLLRIGSDALAARLFRTLPEAARAGDLAGLLWTDQGEAARAIDAARARAARALERAQQIGAAVVPTGSSGYPAWLAQIVDPPIVLWILGDPAVLQEASVAVVGSRRPSAAGLALAERLGRDLAEAGLVVTSGLARGIDGAAHRGALAGGGTTIAVLGSGLDVIYPPSHGGLAKEAARHGCLVSELPPGTQPFPAHFPLRNRIISGLSRAVVVVEAAERSGSLITARMALEQGRSVCAVPGPVAPGAHQGCHALIKDGARLVESVKDVLEETGWRPVGSSRTGDRGKSMADSWLCEFMKPAGPVTADRLAELTARGGADVLAELGRLELEGAIERLPGGWFVRLD
jgi:DNA processing protein